MKRLPILLLLTGCTSPGFVWMPTTGNTPLYSNIEKAYVTKSDIKTHVILTSKEIPLNDYGVTLADCAMHAKPNEQCNDYVYYALQYPQEINGGHASYVTGQWSGTSEVNEQLGQISAFPIVGNIEN